MTLLQELYLGNTIIQYLYFFGTIALFVLAGKAIAWVVQNILRKKSELTKTHLDDHLLDILEKPTVFLIFVGGLYYGSQFLYFSTRFEEIFSNILSILIIVDVAWFIIKITDVVLTHYIRPVASRTESDLDDHLLPIIKKLMRFVVISITIIMIIDNFGYDVTSLVAGLGLGGLAFALAAKDILGNFFGGLAMITDRPFKLGDRIRLDETTDGKVTDIGLRTTRIETLDGTIIIIPNSKLVDSIVENISAEPARKIKMTIGVEYDTSMAKMKKAKKIIEDIIKDHPGTKENSLVAFNEFADSSLNFFIIYWITDLSNILGTKHDINMSIKEKFGKAKISMAFPTRTIYTKKG